MLPPQRLNITVVMHSSLERAEEKWDIFHSGEFRGARQEKPQFFAELTFSLKCQKALKLIFPKNDTIKKKSIVHNCCQFLVPPNRARKNGVFSGCEGSGLEGQEKRQFFEEFFCIRGQESIPFFTHKKPLSIAKKLKLTVVIYPSLGSPPKKRSFFWLGRPEVRGKGFSQENPQSFWHKKN